MRRVMVHMCPIRSHLMEQNPFLCQWECVNCVIMTIAFTFLSYSHLLSWPFYPRPGIWSVHPGSCLRTACSIPSVRLSCCQQVARHGVPLIPTWVRSPWGRSRIMEIRSPTSMLKTCLILVNSSSLSLNWNHSPWQGKLTKSSSLAIDRKQVLSYE